MAAKAELEGKGMVVAKKAPNFNVKDENSQPFQFYEALQKGPALLVFYPGDFRIFCTSQLCTYRDKWSDFKDLGVQVFGLSHNSSEEHKNFTEQYQFPFPLLSDTDNAVARTFGCTSRYLLGGVSRSVVVVSKSGMVLYRYVEPTTLSSKKADELLAILRDLRQNKLL